MSEELSTVRLELDSRAESPALVRAALTGLAHVHGFDPELFDDIKTAVTEACNNVVLYAYQDEPGPYTVRLEVRDDEVAVTVRDWGAGIHQVESSEGHMGVGLAVISALADRAEFASTADGGTEVRMGFAGRGGVIRPLETPPRAESGKGLPLHLGGDVVVTVTPVGLLGGLLGRVARAVAGRTRLSLDRFADIHLISDTLATFASSSPGAGELAFAATAEPRRLELAVGPFPRGDGARLLECELAERPGSRLADHGELKVEAIDDFEVLRVVIDDRATESGPDRERATR